MDTAVLVALFGLIGVAITAVCTLVGLIFVNRSEKKKTSESTMERVLGQRITLKDEQLADAKLDNEELTTENDSLRLENQGLRNANAELMIENERLRAGKV